jgi:hypothetical protein
MKKFNPFFHLTALASLLLLASCQKSLHWPPEEQPIAVKVLPETNCKPAVFGLHSTSGANWTNFAQKWYASNKLSYLKTIIGPSPTFAGWGDVEPRLAVDWGQVTYDGNQVYLKDANKNAVVMRVTIGNQGLPEASYYDNAGLHSDTTYYYHTGTRLDSTISIYRTASVYNWQKYKFTYDKYGSIAKIEGYPQQLQLSFEYDYTQAVSGIIANHHINVPLKVMEYLELVKLPMRHALAKIELGQFTSPPDQPGFNVLVRQEYTDYQITGSGLVHSYTMIAGSNKHTFYNGWDCGTVNTAANINGSQRGIGSRDEFMQRYSFTK